MNRQSLLSSILTLLLPVVAPGVNGQPIFGAAATGLSSRTAYPEQGPWPVLNNPSQLKNNTLVAGVYGFQIAGITELTDLAAAFAMNVPGGSAGIGIHRYGFSLFRETSIRIVYNFAAGPFRTGIAVNHMNVHQGGGFGSKTGRSLDIGYSVMLHSSVTLSGRIDNLMRNGYGSFSGSIPHRVSAGISFHFSDRSISVVEWIRESPFTDSWRFGIESHLLPSFPVRGGIATDPDIWSFGFGYRADIWIANVAVQHHALLGISPGFDLTFQF